MRSLTALILSVSLALPGRVTAEPKEVPMDDLPSFVDPLKLSGADKLPKGKTTVDKEKGLVCYDELMHKRLLLTLKTIEPASDLRAKRAYQAGYLAGFQSGADEVKTVVQKPTYQNAILWLVIGSASSIILMELVK